MSATPQPIETRPFFSIVISVYNRPGEIIRCVGSCLAQSFTDFELIVVDDASTDNTVATIQSYPSGRIHLIRHPVNQGMSAARATGCAAARGQWVVRIDSDHALQPDALAVLHQQCRTANEQVGVIGARYSWDNGWISPPDYPSGEIDYFQRLRWSEKGTDNDYVHCTRRQACEQTPWPNRRGSTNALMELNIARRWHTVIIKECLGIQYTDAANSYHRARRDRKVAQRSRDAADQALTYQEIINEHGSALRLHAPRKYEHYCLMAGFSAFLAGKRRQGVVHTLRFLKRRPFSLSGWTILGSGLIGVFALQTIYRAKR